MYPSCFPFRVSGIRNSRPWKPDCGTRSRYKKVTWTVIEPDVGVEPTTLRWEFNDYATQNTLDCKCRWPAISPRQVLKMRPSSRLIAMRAQIDCEVCCSFLLQTTFLISYFLFPVSCFVCNDIVVSARALWIDNQDHLNARCFIIVRPSLGPLPL